MKFIPYDFRIKKDIDRVRILHWGHCIFIFLAYLVEIRAGLLGFWGAVFWFFSLIWFYRTYFRTVQNLYYTFWTFSGLLLVYAGVNLYNAIFEYQISLIIQFYVVALCFLFVEIYILSSPIYFPRVSWWEYDFRYRTELKIEVTIGDQKKEGRLTDLRRQAGCVVVLDSLNVGEIMHIRTLDGNISLVAEIMSKRESSLGRGVIYGVKFHFRRGEEKNNYHSLLRFVEERKLSQKKLKFRKLKDM